jgi:hypothetical protein
MKILKVIIAFLLSPTVFAVPVGIPLVIESETVLPKALFIKYRTPMIQGIENYSNVYPEVMHADLMNWEPISAVEGLSFEVQTNQANSNLRIIAGKSFRDLKVRIRSCNFEPTNDDTGYCTPYVTTNDSFNLDRYNRLPQDTSGNGVRSDVENVIEVMAESAIESKTAYSYSYFLQKMASENLSTQELTQAIYVLRMANLCQPNSQLLSEIKPIILDSPESWDFYYRNEREYVDSIYYSYPEARECDYDKLIFPDNTSPIKPRIDLYIDEPSIDSVSDVSAMDDDLIDTIEEVKESYVLPKASDKLSILGTVRIYV